MTRTYRVQGAGMDAAERVNGASTAGRFLRRLSRAGCYLARNGGHKPMFICSQFTRNVVGTSATPGALAGCEMECASNMRAHVSALHEAKRLWNKVVVWGTV